MNFLISSFDPMDETSMDLGLNFTMRQRWQDPRLGSFTTNLANVFLTKLQPPIPRWKNRRKIFKPLNHPIQD